MSEHAADHDGATLTANEIELREWLRSQPGGPERWMIIKSGFRRSYDMGLRDALTREHAAASGAGLNEADVWPVHRALGDWMWKDAKSPRLSRDARWRIAEWIVRRERESIASATNVNPPSEPAAYPTCLPSLGESCGNCHRCTPPGEGRT